MADNKVTIDLQIASKGMDPAVQKSQAIRDNLTAAGGAMSRTSGGGGTAGSRAVSEKAAGQEYAAQRGVAGATGASARNFAAESQGLGGLVRLYATVAANTYAAAAAFTALSKAMDTSNMVKGLDQLGAASGRNLGALSKQLVTVTNGAISLRESMQAVAQMSAAGMGSENILKLGKVAEKASQALGVNMSDAVNRLSRGITKLEPELLDELGIFTKIDESNRNYAASLGKSVSALTDFEKRQGFANAVLEEGNKKFGDIKIDPNPYAKLLASLQNITQSGLELINKVLGPLVNILSESPVALAGVLAGIGGLLISKALPALGSWREGLKDAAAQAADASDKITKSFGADFQDKLESYFKIPDLKQTIKDTEKQLTALNKLPAPTVAPTPARLSRIGAAITTDTDAAALKGVNDLIDKRQQKVDTGIIRGKQASAAQIAAAQEEIKWLKTKAEYIEREIQQNQVLERQAKAKAQLIEAQSKLQSKADVPLGRLDPETVAIMSAEKARRRYDVLEATSAAANTANIAGVRVAWAELNKTVEEKGIAGISKWTTLARGGIAAVASRVVGLVGSFGAVSQAIAVVGATAVAAFEILDSWLSTNAKQAKESATAFDALSSSAKFIDEVLENISKKDPLASISTQSITARATAINDLATNTATAFEKVKDTVDKANWWDKFIDGWKSVIGKDLLTVSAKQFSTGIAQQLKAATPSKEKTKAVQSIKDILGVDPQDIEAVNELLSESPEKLMELMPQVSAVMKQFGHEVMNVASKGQQLDDAFTNASKTLDSILVAAIPTDPLAKLGLQTISISQEMTKAFEDPITALSQMEKIANDISKLRFLGNFGEQIQKLGPEIRQSVTVIAALDKQLESLDAQIAAAQEKAKPGLFGITTDKNVQAAKEAERLQQTKTVTSSVRDTEIKKIQPAQELFLKAQSEVFLVGAKFIENSIGIGFKQAAITVQTAYAGLLGDTAGGIELRASLQKQAIQVQSSQIRATEFLIDSQEKLRKAQEDQTDAIRKASLQGAAGDKLSPGERDRQISEIDARVAARKQISEELAKTSGGKQIGLLKSYAQGSSLVGPMSEEEQLKSTALSQAAAAAGTSVFAKQGVSAQLAQKAAETESIDIQKRGQLLQNELKIRQETLAVGVDILDTAKSTFESQLSVLPYLSEDQLARKNALDYAILMNKQLQERNVLETELAKIDIVIKESKDSEAVDRAKKSREEVLQRQQNLGIKQLNETEKSREKNRIEGIQNIKKKELERLDVLKTESDTAAAREQTLYTIKSENIAKLNALGALSPERVAAAQQELDLDAEKLRSAEKLAEIEDKQARARADFTAKLSTAAGGDTTAITAAQAASDAAYQSALDNETRLTAARQANIAVLGANNILLAQQKTQMDSLVLTTESLAAVFGTVGEAVGAVAQALQRSADSEILNLNARIALQQQLAAAEKSGKAEDIAKVNKAIADQDKKSAKDKLNNDIALLNSSKKMFKEKTVAYKALDAIEKVQHVRRIFESNKELITSIMNAGKELATKLGFMATEETAQVSFRASEIAGTAAANAANATSAIPAIFAKFSAMMGPWGWAAAAAVVAALGLKGGSKSPPAGFTAEEQQKVQGTGQMYENGKLVDRAGGVLGDRTAKAKSVGDSIDELSKVFFDVLGSDSSKMLGYLRGIEENTLGLAKALTGSATGVLGDKPLGIGESSRGSGLAGFLFGKSKTSIADQGIEVTGSLEKLSQGIGNFSAYVTTVTKSSGFLGFGGGTRYNTTRDKVETTAVDAIAKIFKNVQGVLVTAAESLEGSGMRVTEVLRDIPIKIKASAKDLSAKEFAEAVQAEISVALNAAAEKAFPYMSEYVRVGEEYWTTVARVNKEGEVLNQGLKMIGLSIIKAAEGTTGMEAAATRVAAQQNLLKAFSGDLDAATSSIQFYFDNFLTEQERSTYYTEQLTTGFKDLGMATVPTLEQFTKMVAGLDANDEAQANTLASLLKLAPAYDKLRQAQEKTSQLQEDLWTLEGKGAQALEAQRARELRSMSAVDAALQRRINALEDEKSAYDKLRGALKETVEGIKTSVIGLRDARNSLLTGPDSFMTPQQRLETQKSQYTTALAAARGPLDTPEQRKTAQTAAQTATRLLQEIKTSGDVLFASGQENVDLRAWLAQTAGETADILEASQVGFEEQIASIDAGTNVLKSVDSTLTSIKTLWADYITAQTITSEAPVNQAPATTQAPNSVADAQVASAMLQVAVQKETNKLLQQQLELQAEQLRSNAIAMKAQTDELNRAAEERRLAAEYAERNKPSFGYASGDGA